MGVGFNSCYHIADSSSFITSDRYVILDPHECTTKWKHQLLVVFEIHWVYFIYELEKGATELKLLYKIQLENADQVRQQCSFVVEKIVPINGFIKSWNG